MRWQATVSAAYLHQIIRPSPEKRDYRNVAYQRCNIQRREPRTRWGGDGPPPHLPFFLHICRQRNGSQPRKVTSRESPFDHCANLRASRHF
jgi:hypothetical protein